MEFGPLRSWEPCRWVHLTICRGYLRPFLDFLKNGRRGDCALLAKICADIDDLLLGLKVTMSTGWWPCLTYMCSKCGTGIGCPLLNHKDIVSFSAVSTVLHTLPDIYIYINIYIYIPEGKREKKHRRRKREVVFSSVRKFRVGWKIQDQIPQTYLISSELVVLNYTNDILSRFPGFFKWGIP